MIDTKLENELKKYLQKLDLVILFNNELIKKNAKTIFYLMKQIKKNRNNLDTLKLCKLLIIRLTSIYILKNNNIAFNYDIASKEINRKQPYSSYCFAFFKNYLNEKYMLINFSSESIGSLNLLKQHALEFKDKIEQVDYFIEINSSFIKDYFKYLLKNNLINSLEQLESFYEVYLYKQITKFFAKKYIKTNKLNIFH